MKKEEAINMEKRFETESVHDLLGMVGHILNNTIDYSNLYNKVSNYTQFKNLYLDSKSSTIQEDLQNVEVDETADEIYNQMILNRREIEKILMINIHQVLEFKETAKFALKLAVKKSKTKAELLQCAKYVEWEIDDRDWAQEIRKKAYGKDWNSSNTTNKVVTINDYDSFIKENEPDLIKYFTSRRPAAYEKALKEEAASTKKTDTFRTK